MPRPCSNLIPQYATGCLNLAQFLPSFVPRLKRLVNKTLPLGLFDGEGGAGLHQLSSKKVSKHQRPTRCSGCVFFTRKPFTGRRAFASMGVICSLTAPCGDILREGFSSSNIPDARCEKGRKQFARGPFYSSRGNANRALDPRARGLGFGFEGVDRRDLFHCQADIIQPFEQAVLFERINIKAKNFAV